MDATLTKVASVAEPLRRQMGSYSAISGEGDSAVLIAPSTPQLSDSSEVLTMRERILVWDRDTSRRLYDASYSNTRLLLLFLEFSGHGVPWVVIPLLLYLLVPQVTAAGAAALLNYMGLAILDLLVIGALKPAVGRKRPEQNGGMTVITIHAIDQYSFPSGHATRAGLNFAFVAYLQIYHPDCLYMFAQSSFFLTIVAIWAAAVAVSRVALGRHHVTDVAFGLLLGVLYVVIWHFVWIPAPVADNTRKHLRHALFGSAL